MIAVVILASLVALTSAAEPRLALRGGGRGGGGAVGAPDAKSYLHMRADLNQVRLDRLTAAVDRAENDLRTFTDHHDDHEVNRLEERVYKVTGDSCNLREFQCGGTVPQCISNLLVCDGSADCDNGHDEDSDVCVNLMTEGSSWVWNANSGNCSALEVVNSGKTMVSSVKRSPYFPSHVKITLISTVEGDDDAITEDARWSFGARNLIVYPAVEGFPLAVCHFQKGVDDYCEGPMMFMDTLKTCGSFNVKKYRD